MPTLEDKSDYPWAAARGWLQQPIFVGCACLLVAAAAVTGYIFWTLPDVSALKSANPESTAMMTQRIEAARRDGRRLNIEQNWVDFERIPKILRDTVRISEDAGFYQHKGIDTAEIRAALRRSWRQKKQLRGASTITQQLAKNLYLSSERSIWRKIREYLIARRLEGTLSKNRIFHLYLNVIELGPGIFGVEAASRHYFAKPVQALELEEIVRLVAIIPRPLTAHPLKSSRWVNWRAHWILDTLLRSGYITSEQHRLQVESFRD